MRVVTVARKPCASASTTANVIEHQAGAVNIDACRVPSDGSHVREGIITKRTTISGDERTGRALGMYGAGSSFTPSNHAGGRWPANVVIDGEDVLLAMGLQSGTSTSTVGRPRRSATPGDGWGMTATGAEYQDAGTAARFFRRVR